MDKIVHDSIRAIADDMQAIYIHREEYHKFQDAKMEKLRQDIDSLLERTHQLQMREGVE